MAQQGLLFVCLCGLLALSLGCKSNTDCMLNGVCTNSKCVCDPGWTNANCSQLNLGKAPLVGAYGYSPNVSAWGGLPTLVSGTYHTYVAEMVDGCGLCTWEHNSRIIHATSTSLLGPYIRKDQAVGIWSHNPQITVDTSSGTPVYVLFHIGAGTGGNPTHCNTTKRSMETEDMRSLRAQKRGAPDNVHYSSSPNGPWTAINPTGYVNCNNIAPLVFKNGTVLLVCAPWGKTWFAMTAPSFRGPYTTYPFTFEGDYGGGIWEDPFIWEDKRGNFHMVSHAFVGGGAAYAYKVGGLAYSTDSRTWTRTPQQPWTNKVTNIDNVVIPYTTRERPKIFFDPTTGNPTALFNGVGGVPAPYGDKDTCGVDWTFNLGVPINA